MRAGVAILGLSLLVAAACSGPAGGETVTAKGPDPSAFIASVGGVAPVFERRCGSIDCHGNPYRAMRIYGQNGIRLPNDAGLAAGSGATTPEEVAATYDSIISVEPEQMILVASHQADPYSLLILKKPLQIEAHKGGPALFKGDDSETCISSWVSGKTNTTACTNGAQPP